MDPAAARCPMRMPGSNGWFYPLHLRCPHWGHLSPLSPMSLCSKNLPVKVGIPPLLDVLVGRQGEKFGELVVGDDLVEQLTSQSKLARCKLLLAKSSLDLR